ncbi:MAG: hypothetical protein H6719_22150 [Sandaracinaceae bacterium]|nr:hypothetical protein [Sandaracinaceae bacterium]
MSQDRDLTLRLVCGLLASAARLVPVPFLDDILRERALQLMVSRTLKARGRSYGSAKVGPLYGDSRGCVEGCAVFVVLLPIRLLLFPFRKILVWVMAVKYIATDLSEAVLLGRALDAVLADGRLPEGAEDGLLREDAMRIRRAFENAMAGTDMKLLATALREALRGVSGLPRAALGALRKLGKKDDADPTEGLSGGQRQAVDEGTSKIQAVLATPEIAALLDRFDTKLAENLAVLEAR